MSEKEEEQVEQVSKERSPAIKCRPNVEMDHLVRIIDTTDPQTEQLDLFSIGKVENKQLTTYHITDNPQRVCDILHSDEPLSKTGRSSKFSELGAGLYGSGVPSYWFCRSISKWNPLKELPIEKRKLVREAVLNEWRMKPESFYLTDYERESVKRDLNHYVEKGDEGILCVLANQPFNFRTYTKEFLAKIGVQAVEPIVMEIKVEGKFAELNGYPEPELLECLQENGLDGAYTPSHINTDPQIVIWNKKVIKSVNGHCKEK